MNTLYYYCRDSYSPNPWKIWKNDELYFFERYTDELLPSKNPLKFLRLIAIYD